MHDIYPSLLRRLPDEIFFLNKFPEKSLKNRFGRFVEMLDEISMNFKKISSINSEASLENSQENFRQLFFNKY